MGWLTLDRAVCKSNIEGRIMKLGHPSSGGPFQFCGLYLILSTRMKGLLFKREAVIDAMHVASGQEVTFSGIGPEFALTLFSNRRMI